MFLPIQPSQELCEVGKTYHSIMQIKKKANNTTEAQRGLSSLLKLEMVEQKPSFPNPSPVLSIVASLSLSLGFKQCIKGKAHSLQFLTYIKWQDLTIYVVHQKCNLQILGKQALEFETTTTCYYYYYYYLLLLLLRFLANVY